MAQYINKDILISQLNIELSNLRKAESEGYINEFGKGKLEGLEGIADFILNYCDIEVDLEEDYKEFVNCDNGRSMFETAKHFFELGLKAQK